MLVGGLTYARIGAGGAHVVLLGSDGAAVACVMNACGQRDPLALGEGLTYARVAAGGVHTVLLMCDGTSVACGWNDA